MSLLKHGGMLFAATLAAAFLGYLYHLFMGRMLGPVAYGELAALFTFIYIIATPTGLSGAMQLTAAREIARLKAAGRQKELLHFAQYFSKKVFFVALALLIVFLFLSPVIASFLHIEILPVVSLAVLLFFYLLLVIPWGLLQGTQSFAPYSASTFLFALLKFAAAVLLVFLGLSVSGALAGIAVGVIVAIIFCFFFIKDLFKKQMLLPKTRFVFFSCGVLLSLFFLMFLINIDILLVKHFFTAEQAGQYSIASLLGKLVYFLAISLATVLLPMVSESADKQKQSQLLKKSIFFTACFAFVLLFAFWFFSKQIVSIFFGPAFAPSAVLLPLFGIAMALFSFSNILVYFEMGIKRNRHVLLLGFASISEAVLLWFFHKSLNEVLLIVVVANAILLAALLLNLFFEKQKAKTSFSGSR